ncbi:MAG: hypothetical protein OXC41_03550 [Gammaproteobacteria bacterium]|nr:hypothetical protein [Gammaproteobacteria bacterium]
MQQAQTTSEQYFGGVISSYTRKQAIEDGVLVDVSETAKEAGFKVPVALTQAVYEDCVVWADKDAKKYYQDESGRLWDIFSVARFYARARPNAALFFFQIYRLPRVGHGGKRHITLKCLIHGGDNGEPVITIMQPQED